MKSFKSFFLQLFVIVILVAALNSCEKEFVSLDSDVVNNNIATNFSTNSERYDVVAYTKVLGPVQTNNLPIYALGVYNDPVYGKTTSSILTQISSPNIGVVFFGENPVLDSVVLTIPYFSRRSGLSENNQPSFTLDSVFSNNPIKLSIYESNFFLRDFDPSQSLNERQSYFSNGATSLSDQISTQVLEHVLINEFDNISPDSDAIVLLNEEGDVSETLNPALRLSFDNLDYWQSKILDKEGDPVFNNQSNFANYFRGIYFKAEGINDIGSYMLLNLSQVNANITLYYKRDTSLENQDRISASFILNFSGNRVNLIDNEPVLPIEDGNSTTGDEQLFLKGTQGSIAVLELFERDENGNSQFLDNLRDAFKDPVTGRKKRMINEANLIVHVDPTLASNLDQPQRLYLYDLNNRRTLFDYLLDNNNNAFPEVSIINHLGPLRPEPGIEGGGKHKFRITQHINNIIFNDSTNVKLGLAISGNVNLESSGQFNVLTSENNFNRVPLSTLITPRSTVLHGNQSPVEEKRLYLEIFYTEPEN